MEALLCARYCLPLLSISKPAWHSHVSIIAISYIKFLSVSLASQCVKTAGWSFTQFEGEDGLHLRMVLLHIWATGHKISTIGHLGWRGVGLSFFVSNRREYCDTSFRRFHWVKFRHLHFKNLSMILWMGSMYFKIVTVFPLCIQVHIRNYTWPNAIS